jgi:hypothetical protein
MENRTREYDFCIRTFEGFTGKEKITFKHGKDTEIIYEKESYDWYIIVAIEKCDLIKEDRHLITRELVLSYRWAIREGYNHQLDRSLQNAFDRPRNRNTIKGVKGYIELIEKKSKANES